MLENAQKISEEKPEFLAKFQEKILEHWHQIAKDKCYPSKQDFRPQNFPKYLPQLAIVSVDGDNNFAARLTGNTVSEVLLHSTGRSTLVNEAADHASCVVRNMLGQTNRSQKPMYFEGKFLRNQDDPSCTTHTVEFSALVLPFSQNSKSKNIDSLLLAFDFSKRAQLEASSNS